MPESRRQPTLLRAVLLAGRVASSAVGVVVCAALLLVLVGSVLHLGLSPVLSGSMRPTYAPGDAVLTRPMPVQSLRPGDIAVFVPPGESAPYAHRITTISGDPARPVLTTRGDANPVGDPWHATLSGPTVPVVVGTLPKVGWLLARLPDPRTRALLVLVLGLLGTTAGVRMILRLPETTAPTRSGPRPA